MDRVSESAPEPIEVEVVTAAPLSDEQMASLYRRLVQYARRQIRLAPRVDPSLIAGMRLMVQGVVVDTSIKQQLIEMKKKLYKGVYAPK